MRNIIIGVCLVVCFPVRAIAASESLSKLSAEGLCTEYGFRRGSGEFDHCMSNVLRAAGKQTVTEPVGLLFDAVGEVQLTAAGFSPQAAAKDDPLESEMIVSTGENSEAVLKFIDGQVIALQSNSSLHIHDYRYTPGDVRHSNIFLSLEKGGIRAINGLIGRKHPAAFRLETRDATLGVHGTDFVVVVNDQMFLRSNSGMLQLDNEAGTTVLISGQGAVTTSEKILPAPVNVNELPPDVFSKLMLIPVPDSKPIVIKQAEDNFAGPVSVPVPVPAAALPAAMSPANPVLQQDKAASESLCEGYGYIKGSDGFKWCVENSVKAAASKAAKGSGNDIDDENGKNTNKGNANNSPSQFAGSSVPNINIPAQNSGQTFCENYGYVKGTPEYKDCMATAADNGYSGDAEKHQDVRQ